MANDIRSLHIFDELGDLLDDAVMNTFLLFEEGGVRDLFLQVDLATLRRHNTTDAIPPPG